MNLGVIITLIASVYLAGLSVTVGLVTYPSFRFVEDENWLSFHRHRSSRITWAVGPAWLSQALGLGIWLFAGPQQTWIAWALTGASALLAVLLTVFGAVPIHQQLRGGFDQTLNQRLLTYHWLRTIAWFICVGGTTWALAQIS
jgi:hypothetical protein